jgi:2-oxoglutarate ferredoxin oxidoreductase subunit alpha
VKGGGHGDYRVIVLAPDSVQELYSLTYIAFDLADAYRNPVMILADAMLGQMKEPLLRQPPPSVALPEKDWAVSGKRGRSPNVIKSLFLGEGELEAHIWKLAAKYDRIKQEAVQVETMHIQEADLVVVAFGTAARICISAVREARKQGLRVGLVRPITLFPFPEKILRQSSRCTKSYLTVELNTGQMVEDVRLSVGYGAEVHFYGRPCGAGSLPTPGEILEQIRSLCRTKPLAHQETDHGTRHESRV